MASATLAKRASLNCRRASRLLRTSRYQFCDKSNRTNSSYWKTAVIGLGLLATSGITAYVGYYTPSNTRLDTEKEKLRQIKEMFVINIPPEMPFPRKEARKQWRKFMASSLTGSTGKVIWMYGDKNIGKSTILESIAYELQQECISNDSKKQIFYIQLETVLERQECIRNLQDALLNNQRKGIQSLVIMDGVGVMGSGSKTALLEDITQKEFDSLVHSKGEWVEIWFDFVKGCSDRFKARFIFLTSKPDHLAINQRGFAYRIRDRSIQIDVNEEDEYREKLQLKLNKKEAISFIQYRQHLVRDDASLQNNGEKFIQQIQEMDENAFFSSDLSRIGFLQTYL